MFRVPEGYPSFVSKLTEQSISIWPNYLADSWTKSQELTNTTSISHRNFVSDNDEDDEDNDDNGSANDNSTSDDDNRDTE